MNFLIYDESGQITQSNKVYDPTGYADVLNERDLKFISVQNPDPLHMNEFWVSKGELTGRPEMPFNAERITFKADGSDAARISGLPMGVRVSVIATGGIRIASNEVLNTGFIEIPSPIAAEYEILLELFPYRSKTIKVVAI